MAMLLKQLFWPSIPIICSKLLGLHGLVTRFAGTAAPGDAVRVFTGAVMQKGQIV